MTLNPSQATAVEVALRRLEQTLLQARQLLQQPPEAARLTHYRPVPAAVRAGVDDRIGLMLDEIERLTRDFGLQPEVVDLRQQMAADMVVAWADLSDSLSPKLRRYGAADPDLARELDPRLGVLIQACLEIGQLLNRPGEHTHER